MSFFSKKYPVLTIYCDGACWKNGHPDARAAFAWYCIETKEGKAGDGAYNGKSTNNTGELLGVLHSLEYAKGKTRNVRIVSDSLYAINSVSVWGLSPKKMNIELIQKCKTLLTQFESVEFEWVKGHHLSKWNNHVDQMATNFIALNPHSHE